MPNVKMEVCGFRVTIDFVRLDQHVKTLVDFPQEILPRFSFRLRADHNQIKLFDDNLVVSELCFQAARMLRKGATRGAKKHAELLRSIGYSGGRLRVTAFLN